MRNLEKSSANVFDTRWDDWVPQDRLRKLTEDNRELAASLRREVMQSESRQRNSKSTASSKKGRTQGSEIGSGRGSEERNSSVPAGGRGTKRGKDNEIEKVATPDFPIPRRSSRMQSSGSSLFPNPYAGSSYVSDIETEASQPSSELGLGLFLAAQSAGSTDLNEEGPFHLQDAPGGRAGTASRGIKTMALRTIHGRYDEDQNLIPSKPEVLSRRGFFKEGVFSSPDLESATNIKSQAGPRHSRRSEKQAAHKNKGLPMPDEATATDEFKFTFVMDVLSRPPPPDEPEHMTADTFNFGHHFAPLIGGTSDSERAQIEDDARQMGLSTPKQPVHPQYDKCRVNDPNNAARLHFFQDQDPARKLMIAGVPKDPTHLDPPGSGSCFDILRFPDRLVKLPARVLGKFPLTDLHKLDRSTVIRFPKAALRMLPPKFLARLKIPIPPESETDSNDNNVQEEDFFARPSVQFTLPDPLKGYLVDDWENVTKNLTIVELPSQAPANWVLDSYFHEEKGKRRLGSAEAKTLFEIVDGMKQYFAKMLGRTLLYKFERVQYADVCQLLTLRYLY
jgi:MRG